MSSKKKVHSKRYEDVESDVNKAMARKHPPKPGLGKMHVPADLRALGITSMKEFLNG